jgi:hypothetical protein
MILAYIILVFTLYSLISVAYLASQGGDSNLKPWADNLLMFPALFWFGLVFTIIAIIKLPFYPLYYIAAKKDKRKKFISYLKDSF